MEIPTFAKFRITAIEMIDYKLCYYMLIVKKKLCFQSKQEERGSRISIQPADDDDGRFNIRL